MNTALQFGSKRASRVSLLLAILLVIFGVFAIILPIATSIGVAIVIGWLAIFEGLTQVVHAFRSQGIGHIAWKLIVAIVYLAAGAYLLAHPALGVAGLTLALGIFLFAEGLTDVAAYFAAPNKRTLAWMLADGVITLILGFMIWSRWPFGSLWVIGTLVGISMVMTGTTRFMMGLSMRRAAKRREDSHVDDSHMQGRAA